jgi:hypothetical protein
MKHLVKRGAVKPTADQLDNWQLGFDYVSGDLYIKIQTLFLEIK